MQSAAKRGRRGTLRAPDGAVRISLNWVELRGFELEGPSTFATVEEDTIPLPVSGRPRGGLGGDPAQGHRNGCGGREGRSMKGRRPTAAEAEAFRQVRALADQPWIPAPRRPQIHRVSGRKWR